MRCLGMLGLRPGAYRSRGGLRLLRSVVRGFRHASSRLSCDWSHGLFWLTRSLSFGLDGLCFAFFSLALLLRLLDFLGFVFDAGKIAEYSRPILWQFCLSTKLHFKQLLDDLVEFRPASNSQGVEFPKRQRLTQRTPFLDVVAEF